MDQDTSLLLPQAEGIVWENNILVPRELYMGDFHPAHTRDGEYCWHNPTPIETAFFRIPGQSSGEYAVRRCYHDEGKEAGFPLVRVVQYHQDGQYVSIHTIRLQTKNPYMSLLKMYHVMENMVSQNKQVLFCDSLGKKVISDLTVDQLIEFQKRVAFFTKRINFFKPINNPLLGIKALCRLIFIDKNGSVQVRDWFDKRQLCTWPSYGSDDCLAYVIYDDNFHVYAMYMDEKSSQIIQQYIEDHEF